MLNRSLAITLLITAITACGASDKKKTTTANEKLPADSSQPVTTPSSVELEVLSSYVSGAPFASSAAEIVSYDKSSDKLYVVNSQAASVDILTLDDHQQLTKSGTIDLQAAATDAGITIGAANSVVAKNGLVAVAIEAQIKQQMGIVALYQSSDLALIKTFPTGALPDMVSMTSDSHYILTANEGEPNADYSVDPEGSVTLIDISKLLSDNISTIQQINFHAFNQGQPRHNEVANIRLPGPTNTSVAEDLEPEYIALLEAEGKAIVALQENNAVAIINYQTGTIESIKDLGVKDWSQYQLDVTDKDKVFEAKTFNQLVGYYMPDTIVGYQYAGKSYFVSANEGDSRKYGEFSDESKISKLDIAAGHPLALQAAEKNGLGRLKALTDQGKTIAAGDTIYTMGARSISVWNDQAELLADTGDTIAKQVYQADNNNFNSDNESNQSSDSRSDAKGSEPEALEVAIIENRVYAFVGLERQGGIMTFDITNPQQTIFMGYVNNRDFNQDVCTSVDSKGECDNDTYNPLAKDLGPESIKYIQRDGMHLLAVGNEVSGTTTLYNIHLK